MTILSRACAVSLLHDHRKLLRSIKAVVAIRRTNHSFATWRDSRQQRRSTKSPPSTLFATTIRRRRNKPPAAVWCRSLAQLSDEDLQRHNITSSIGTRSRSSSIGTGTSTSFSLEDMTRAERVRRGSTIVERGPLDSPLLDNASVNSIDLQDGDEARRHAHRTSLRRSVYDNSMSSSSTRNSNRNSVHSDYSESMRPPATPAEDVSIITRSSRSTSSASRNTNRLSITLPIAVPTHDPSRPIPSSAASVAAPSVPGTPARQTPSSLTTPVEPNEFIIAIAAQERRVLELREELTRAEDELKSLKRQWTLHEAYKKAGDRRQQAEQARPVASTAAGGVLQPESWPSTPTDEELAAKRTVELDRRKMLLLQQAGLATPRDERKRVFSGRHARTLSLLSPTRSETAVDNFTVLEDKAVCRSPDASVPPTITRRQSVANKRASWQPQSHSASASMSSNHGYSTSTSTTATAVNPMSQIVEDFKLGFRTFYEDIRQITVGDEPINGSMGSAGSTAVDYAARGGSGTARQQSDPEGQDTIRQSTTGRPKLAAAFEPPAATEGETEETPSKSKPRAPGLAAAKERNSRARNKHFSWTPLSFDGIDGEAWLNFDSPSSTGKSTRWSGSTMNDEDGEGAEATTAKTQEVESPLSSKKTMGLGIPSPAALSPQRLEELTAQVVNRLSPSNLKRTATDLVTGLERTLAEAAEVKPAHQEGDKENFIV